MKNTSGSVTINGEFILVNQEICSAIEVFAPKSSDLTVYEVLRIIDSVPLFFDDHIKRLFHSCELVGKTIDIDVDSLFQKLVDLSKCNNFSMGNVMLRVVFYSNQVSIMAYFIPHHYPDELTFKNGIEVGILHAERLNPEAKVVQPNVREAANKLIESTGVYEVLLVNNNQKLTEGSRSNLFFIRDNTLFTAPMQLVLKGITYCKVIQLAKELAINVRFEQFSVNDLKLSDALFITGTSSKILPIRKEGANIFNVNHEIIVRLMKTYDALITNDIVLEKKRLIK